jgi:acyl CoA:acetate/3-ketoacid CoA transferase beta subunit
MIITEMAVIEVTSKGLLLREVAADTSVEAVQAATGPRLIVADPLATFD